MIYLPTPATTYTEGFIMMISPPHQPPPHHTPARGKGEHPTFSSLSRRPHKQPQTVHSSSLHPGLSIYLFNPFDLQMVIDKNVARHLRFKNQGGESDSEID